MEPNGRKGDDSAAGGGGAELEAIAHNAGGAERRQKRPPPVESWNPPFCGDLDIRIKRDGSWHYLGTPINREPLVRLFGTILRKDADGKTYLVTPVEKVGITVEDAHFIGVDVNASGNGESRRIEFETNHADRVTLDRDHPLRIEFDAETGEPTPYITVRGRLEARLDRKSFVRLVDLAVEEQRATGAEWGVWSCGTFFSLGAA